MSSATVNKQELLLRDLRTSSVTLYPSNALVVRELSVELEPGQNEIEVYGLSPTIDESSVRLEGHGAATVTDITVDLVVNREKFADVYPDDDLDAEDSDTDEPLDPEADDTEEVKRLREELKTIDAEVLSIKRVLDTVNSRRQALENFAQKADTKSVKLPERIEELKAYQNERLEMGNEFERWRIEEIDAEKRKEQKERELHVADRESRRHERRELLRLEKVKERKARKKLDEIAAKQRERAELLKFWPKKVYRIVVHLDTAVDTPMSSRRSSVTTHTLVATTSKGNDGKGAPEGSQTVSLSLSYTTRDAFWKPAYDINLETQNLTGSIVYRAEFMNQTSETWEETKLWLSTSNTHFGGVDEKVPWMHRWSIALSKRSGNWDCTCSWEEAARPKHHTQGIQQAGKITNRSTLFGEDGSEEPIGLFQSQAHKYHKRQQIQYPNQQPVAQIQYASRRQVQNDPTGASGPVAAQPRGGLFGAGNTSTSLFGGAQVENISRAEGASSPGAAMNFEVQDEAFIPETIDYEETNFEDHGLTTTYEVPGSRTIAPSSLTRRHKIVTLSISNLVLNSIAVPKLRAAAFLRARFRNPSSSITLLKGNAGITLDGTYLGGQLINRLSPGELLTIPLGVDPAVHISYAKPTVRRGTQGIVPFNKAASQTYSREIVISNTKSSPIELYVLDQIPVSEDDRLRVEIVNPKGFNGVNSKVRTGTAVQASVVAANTNTTQPQSDSKKWGRAEAMLKDDGEVAWTVKLEKASACKLPLEFEIRAPSNEAVVNRG